MCGIVGLCEPGRGAQVDRELLARATVTACQHAGLPVGLHGCSAIGAIGHDRFIGRPRAGLEEAGLKTRLSSFAFFVNFVF